MNKSVPMFIGFIVLLLAVWLQLTTIPFIRHFLTRLSDIVYDTELRTQVLIHPKLTQSPVVVVDIDDFSLTEQGRWPWPRSKIATLIKNLQDDGAVVIALDILFSEKEENIVDTVLQKLKTTNLSTGNIILNMNKVQPLFNNDLILAKTLAQGETVLGVAFIPHSENVNKVSPYDLTLAPAEQKLNLFNAIGVISNIPIIQATAKGVGFINVFPDEDGVVRHALLLMRFQNYIYPSLALEAVRRYWLTNLKLITAPYHDQLRLEDIQIGARFIPTDSSGQIIVPFIGPSFTFPYYSASNVINKKFPANAFLGKIVFIGTSATALGDLKATAVQNVYPGIEVQATIANGIITNHFFYKPAWSLGVEVFITLFFGIIFIFLFPFCNQRTLFVSTFAIPATLIFGNNLLWEKTGIFFSFIVPCIFFICLTFLNMIYSSLFEVRRRERLKEIFGQYIPATHIDEMLESTASYGMYGEEREMTVLFADIRNFTALSEFMHVSRIKELLNDFFTVTTEIIFKYRGTIDKYVGDMLMAFWGAPVKDKRHAYHAISAALDMQIAVKKMQPALEAKGLPAIRFGVAINSGIMNVGDMGSKFRRSYTVLGDEVNLASRLEALNDYYGAEIIVSEHTERNQAIFLFRKLDRVRVKGKEVGIEIFEPICRRSAADPQLIDEVNSFHTALDYYFAREWKKARTVLEVLYSTHPNVKVYSIFLQRISDFEQSPPPENWDGIFTHISK